MSHEQTNVDNFLATWSRNRQEMEQVARLGMQALPVSPNDASAALISILSSRNLENVGESLAALTAANEMVDDPTAIRQALVRQVPVLEALMNRLILLAMSAKPEASCRYLGTAMTVQSALLKVLGALYETRKVSA
jgi:hypothetical protein